VTGKFFQKNGVAKLVSHQRMQTKVGSSKNNKDNWGDTKLVTIFLL